MAGMKIRKVNALPAQLEANCLYFVKGAAELMDIYLTGDTADLVQHVATQEETLSGVVLYGDTPPALPNKCRLWWHTEEGALYVQYNDGTSTYWVESMPSIAVPEFAGTGTASTMARSDHNHDDTYVSYGMHQW